MNEMNYCSLLPIVVFFFNKYSNLISYCSPVDFIIGVSHSQAKKKKNQMTVSNWTPLIITVEEKYITALQLLFF